MGWCRGGNRNVDRAVGIPSIENNKVSKFQSFKVSWFLGFLVFWFLGVFVPSFQSVQVSEIHKPFNVFWKILKPSHHIPISYFLEDTDPIWDYFHHLQFMFS